MTAPTPTQPPQGVMAERLYAERDHMALDKAGNFYSRHVYAMTHEGLHAKSDIAAELAWRDQQLSALLARCEGLEAALREIAGCVSCAEAHWMANDALAATRTTGGDHG